MTTRLFSIKGGRLTLGLIGLMTLSHSAGGAEPLHGPILSSSWWLESPIKDGDRNPIVREQSLSTDIPIPVSLGLGMPFALARLTTKQNQDESSFAAYQDLGLGFMHHSAEGDPAWRAEIRRIGLFSTRPTVWARGIINLIKPFPWLRPRPSDSTWSWMGVNIIKGPEKSYVIPEISWIRHGRDGLAMDLVLPEHALVGYQGPSFGALIGLEQSFKKFETHEHNDQDDPWTLRRFARLKFSLLFLEEFQACTSLLKTLDESKSNSGWGADVSFQWRPIP